ncbi:DUF397 domain-containing protein [Streptomyces solincola]|uniref:DUF397 domain-containing protein n=1 Tax=Streptomyces solincola TaxID=2100817 RepID=A0A2S9Q0P8_9ACTN|nr:DUF397 domain-containing protein [Streptomyces solincola]PRH80187.1 DUF397 domain-containing protein [Streptomyces solincola]
MSTTELAWFKSSYSGSAGDNCVEVAWVKSSYSSGSGDNCVEVANTLDAVRVRDSKDKSGPQLAVAPGSWASFVSFAARG